MTPLDDIDKEFDAEMARITAMQRLMVHDEFQARLFYRQGWRAAEAKFWTEPYQVAQGATPCK